MNIEYALEEVKSLGNLLSVIKAFDKYPPQIQYENSANQTGQAILFICSELERRLEDESR